MKRTFFLLLTAVVLFAFSQSAAAQKFLPKTIQFKGAPEYSDQELLAASGVKKGTVLNYSEMRDHSKRLMDSGVFDTVSFTFDGVDLVFKLAPSTILYDVHLENLPLTPGKELDTKLNDRFPLYHGKVPSENGLLEDVRGALEEMLEAEGIKAAIAAAPYTDHNQHKVTAMSFAITAPPVRVGSIHLEGVSSALQLPVKRIADRESGTPFGTEDSTSNLENQFKLFYADEGYAAVKVHASRSGDPLVTSEAIDIPFTVNIEEGRLYKLGSVHIPSNAFVTQAEIDNVISLRASEMSKEQTLHNTWFVIAYRCKSKGYMACVVTPHPQYDDANGIVNYTVEVIPGPVYHLASVKFENVSEELRSRLISVWQMPPSAPFDESYLSSFIVQAQNADPVLLRSLSGIGATYDLTTDQQTHEVNCVIHFVKTTSVP